MTYDALAGVYDLLYADKDYAGEAAWVLRACARVSKGVPPGRILDVACGTGRHAEAFATSGIEVVGVDASPGMIAMARRRLPNAVFHVGDMSALDGAIANGTFDAATCLFDSLGHAGTNARILAALQGMARALRPRGIAIIEVWHAAAVSRFEARRVRRLPGGLVRLSETTIDIPRQSATVRWTLSTPNAPPVEEVHENRFFGTQELGVLLHAAGFELRSLAGGFGDVVPSESSFHLVAVAQRAAGDGAALGRLPALVPQA